MFIFCHAELREAPSNRESVQVSPNFDPRGYIMISGALLADAVIGNIQEKNMKKYNGSSNEVVRLYSRKIL